MQSRMMRFILTHLDPHAEVIMRQLVTLKPVYKPELSPDLVAVVLLCAGAIALVTGAGIRMPPILILLASQVVLTVIPFPFAITAAILATTWAQTDIAPLVTLTNVSGRAVFQGYFLAVLLRLRLLLMVQLVVTIIYLNVLNSLEMSYRSDVIYWPIQALEQARFLAELLFPFQILGLTLLATAQGVNIGLTARRSITISVALTGGITLLFLILFGLSGALIAPTYRTISYDRSIPTVIAVLAASVGMTLVITVLPFVITVRAWNSTRTSAHARVLPE
jgi:hypothetical protein